MMIFALIVMIYMFAVAVVLELLLHLLRLRSVPSRLIAGAILGFLLISAIGEIFPSPPERVTSETETPFLLGTILGLTTGALTSLIANLTRKKKL